MAMIKAITPPNLFGILRRIEYANRKYHSGWMWMGVVIGLAIIEFSGSIKIFGVNKDIKRRVENKQINPI
jgi:hypothetical protein